MGHYGGPQVQCSSAMHIAAQSSRFIFTADHFSALLSISVLCRVFFLLCQEF